eukprot:752805-Hanusia_phi.AAC.3
MVNTQSASCSGVKVEEEPIDCKEINLHRLVSPPDTRKTLEKPDNLTSSTVSCRPAPALVVTMVTV